MPYERRQVGQQVTATCQKLVPGEGIEPPTNGLQNRCSTAELARQTGAFLAFRSRDFYPISTRCSKPPGLTSFFFDASDGTATVRFEDFIRQTRFAPRHYFKSKQSHYVGSLRPPILARF